MKNRELLRVVGLRFDLGSLWNTKQLVFTVNHNFRSIKVALKDLH